MQVARSTDTEFFLIDFANQLLKHLYGLINYLFMKLFFYYLVM